MKQAERVETLARVLFERHGGAGPPETGGQATGSWDDLGELVKASYRDTAREVLDKLDTAPTHTGKSKGTKVFTTVREFELADDYEAFRNRFESAMTKGAATIDGKLLDDTITFNLENIVAFIPMIDLGF